MAVGKMRPVRHAKVLEPDMRLLAWCPRIALFNLDEYEGSKAAFEDVQRLDSANTQAKTWIRKCQAELDGEPVAVIWGA
jgi:hypothetical protein